MGMRAHTRIRKLWNFRRDAQRKKIPKTYNYVDILCDIIDKEHSIYEEATENKEWKDAMIKEYQQIMMNDVWEIVPRSERKYVVTYKWIYKIRHVAYGSIHKYKARFIA